MFETFVMITTTAWPNVFRAWGDTLLLGWTFSSPALKVIFENVMSMLLFNELIICWSHMLGRNMCS